MINITELNKFFDELLEPTKFQDFGSNGLQVTTGTSIVNKISFAVTATQESIDEAVANNSNTLVCHHGLLWNWQGVQPITGNYGKRLSKLIKNDVNLFAYHLPLDAHIGIGNASVLGELLGVKIQSPFGDYKGMPTGIYGRIDPITVGLLQDKLTDILDHEVIISTDNKQKVIKTVGIITGAAGNEWKYALDKGCDAYITGEMGHHHWTDSRESGITIFACGHEATEELGIIALMNSVKKKFGDEIEVEFIKSKNPI